MRKSLKIYFLFGGLIVSLLGCGNASNEYTATKTVTVMQAESQIYDAGLDYIGLVQPKETYNYAFLTGGKIEEIYVAKGDYVNAGDKLAKLDTTQLELTASISANAEKMAQNTIDSLKGSLEASKMALETTQLNLERYQKLYEIGAVSESDLENLQLEYVSQKATHTQLENELSAAQTSVNNSALEQQQILQNLSDATLVASNAGVVMELPYKVGEIIGAGTPVVVTKSEALMVTVGVSVEDYGALSKDCAVAINGSINGKIDTIAAYPDEKTRSYTVEISFTDASLSVGDIVDITIFTRKERGYFIPLTSVFQIDGLDYVFVVNEENRVNKQQVTLGEINGSYVCATGLEEKSLVVVDGIKLLNENDIVAISDGDAA